MIKPTDFGFVNSILMLTDISKPVQLVHAWSKLPCLLMLPHSDPVLHPCTDRGNVSTVKPVDTIVAVSVSAGSFAALVAQAQSLAQACNTGFNQAASLSSVAACWHEQAY